MKRILLIPVLMSLLLSPAIVLANDNDNANGAEAWPAIESPQDLIKILDTVARWLMTIVFIVAAIFIVVAAYRFVTSGGDPMQVTSARQAILYALIGVAVALLAWGIVQVVKSIILG